MHAFELLIVVHIHFHINFMINELHDQNIILFKFFIPTFLSFLYFTSSPHLTSSSIKSEVNKKKNHKNSSPVLEKWVLSRSELSLSWGIIFMLDSLINTSFHHAHVCCMLDILFFVVLTHSRCDKKGFSVFRIFFCSS